MDSAQVDLSTARDLLRTSKTAPERALLALERAAESRLTERGRLVASLLSLELIRWGSRLRALSAEFTRLDTQACRVRRAELAELAAEGDRMASRFREDEASATRYGRSVERTLAAALEACRKLDEALLVREVTLLSRPPGSPAGVEGPELLLPDVDGLLDGALAGLGREEREAAMDLRVNEEIEKLEAVPGGS
jgi:hypothetical protein